MRATRRRHDINGDGVINIRDLVALQYHMGQAAPAPAPAAAAAVVYRVDASPEGSTAAQPLRAVRRAVERRDAAAADRALSVRTETPVASTTNNATSSLRARRTARAAASAVDALFGDER